MKTPLLLLFFLVLVYQTKSQILNFEHLNYSQIDSVYQIYVENGNSELFLPLAQAAEVKAKKDKNIPDTAYARVQFYLGYAYDYVEKDYPKAVEYYQKAINIFEKKAPSSIAYGDVLFTMAEIYSIGWGKYSLAEKYYIQAIKVYSKNKEKAAFSLASCLNSLAASYWQMSIYEKAEMFYSQAKEIYLSLEGYDSGNVADMINNMGLLYQQMGNYDKAEQFLLEAKAIQLKVFGEKDPNYATPLNNLALLYFEMGNYERAEPLFLETMHILEKTLDENHADLSIVKNNLAMVYSYLGIHSKAEELYKQAIKIDEYVYGFEHPSFAMTLNNLALLYNRMGEIEKSRDLFLQVTDIQRKTIGEESYDYALGLNNLAMVYADLKEYDKSEQLFLKTNALWTKNLGTENPTTAFGLKNLAELYLKIGKLDTALHYIQESFAANSLDIEDSNFNRFEKLDQFKYYSSENVHLAISVLLSILEQQYLKTGDKNKIEMQYQIIQAAIRLNDRIRNDFSDEGSKLRSLALNNDYVLLGIKTSIRLGHKNYPQEAFHLAEANKGILLMDAAKTANAYKFGNLPDSLARKEQELQKIHHEVKAKLLEKRSQIEKDSLLTILNKNNAAIEDFTKTLKNQYPQYANLKYQNKTAQVSEIQALLDEQTALLEYVIGDSVIYIFYVSKDNVELIKKNISSTILSNKIKDLHHSLSNYQLLGKDKTKAYFQYTGNAYWFYENLVAPALVSAKKIKKLIVVSDGELGHLPFEAFLVESAPQKETDYKNLHFLINDYQISYNYSATLFKSNKEASPSNNNGQIFALAANYASASLSTMDNNIAQWRLPSHQRLRSMLKPLDEAQKEVQTLAESFNGFFAFDKDASEKNFKEKAGDYAVIHLAMHGLLDAKNPILSSLAFTEDGDSLENNFLQAYEISKMKLNADLVILSACETGFGRFEKGNGIASLAQAFAYAGAPAMIVSLWQVSDFATSAIMKNLYQNLANGMDKDQALQAAKIQYLKEAQGIAAHPAFWSPFVLMGNTDAVYLKTKSNSFFFFLIGTLAILTLISFIIIWKLNRK